MVDGSGCIMCKIDHAGVEICDVSSDSKAFM